MKILALPRDANPYQNLLYGEMRQLNVQVSYMGRLTPSRTINLLLLPAELAARRLAGGRLVHLHWRFAFAVPGGPRSPALRRLAQAWFGIWLRTVRLLGMRLVWTAHNVLPHSPVFADEASALRALVRASDLVIAHSPSTLRELSALGAEPRRTAVIPQGRFAPAGPTASLPTPGAGGRPCQFLFFGQVLEYKGVEELLRAFADMTEGVAARLTVAGDCPDARLRSRLQALARSGGERIALRLERVPDEEVTPLLAAADQISYIPQVGRVGSLNGAAAAATATAAAGPTPATRPGRARRAPASLPPTHAQAHAATARSARRQGTRGDRAGWSRTGTRRRNGCRRGRRP